MNKSYQQQYAETLRKLIDFPTKVGESRIGKINSIFSEQMRIDLQKEFPLMDIKKIKFSNIAHELLWMIRGDTNVKYLIENDCHIWTDDAYRYYKEKYAEWEDENLTLDVADQIRYLSKEDFIKKTLKGEEEIWIGSHRYLYGDLDRIYGKQWRKFNGRTDQLQNCIDTLIDNPDDRRMIVTAHNPADIEEGIVGLPSCHNYFQFYSTLHEDGSRTLSTFVNIRSNDMFLGNPYNVAQYALLTHIIGSMVNMSPDELVINSVDCHLYHAHFDAAEEWLKRYDYRLKDEFKEFETNGEGILDLSGGFCYCKAEMEVPASLENIDDYSVDDFILMDYEPDKYIKAELLT
jgi:thymidylate synthase